jgi:hypothetical protein
MIKLFGAIKNGRWPLLFVFNLVLFSLWILTGNVLAQSSIENPPGILMAASDQGFRYMTGGVGLEEREIIESWGADYNLKLSFAELSGDYLSDVRVTMQDQNGKNVINMTTNGPWLYVKLPPGTYDVEASFEGETRHIENLHLPKGDRVTRLLHWDLD